MECLSWQEVIDKVALVYRKSGEIDTTKGQLFWRYLKPIYWTYRLRPTTLNLSQFLTRHA